MNILLYFLVLHIIKCWAGGIVKRELGVIPLLRLFLWHNVGSIIGGPWIIASSELAGNYCWQVILLWCPCRVFRLGWAGGFSLTFCLFAPPRDFCLHWSLTRLLKSIARIAFIVSLPFLMSRCRMVWSVPRFWPVLRYLACGAFHYLHGWFGWAGCSVRAPCCLRFGWVKRVGLVLPHCDGLVHEPQPA